MAEWVDADDYAAVEDLVDDLVSAAGRTPADGHSKKKNSLVTCGDRTRVSARVAPEVRERFASYAKEHCDDSLGVAFARACRAYRLGGRASRLEDKLGRVVDDATALLAETADGTTTHTDDGLSAKERKVITICSRLGEQFVDDELVEHIHDVAGRSAQASQPTVEDYRERVTTRLDVERHPKNPDLWIPRAQAEDLSPDAEPAVCRRPVTRLDRDQRVRRIQFALGLQAAQCAAGRSRLTTATIEADVLDNDVSRTTVLELMETAAFDPGYEIDGGETTSLRVDLKAVGERDPAMFDSIIEYRDAVADGVTAVADGPGEATLSDYERDTSPDVTAELDSLTSASAATDGGQDVE